MATKKVQYTVTQEDINSKKFADKPELKAGDVIEIEVEDTPPVTPPVTAQPPQVTNTSGKKILYTVTKDDVTKKKYPGKKVGDKIEINAPDPIETKIAGDDDKKAFEQKMERYKKCYPNEKTFFIATDGQVFLSANKVDANNHQKNIDADKKVIEYNV